MQKKYRRFEKLKIKIIKKRKEKRRRRRKKKGGKQGELHRTAKAQCIGRGL